jgi:hypothetical protein
MQFDIHDDHVPLTCAEQRYRTIGNARVVRLVQQSVIDHLIEMLRFRCLYPSDYFLEPVSQPNQHEDQVRVLLSITGMPCRGAVAGSLSPEKALYDLIMELLEIHDKCSADESAAAAVILNAATVLFRHDISSPTAADTLLCL